MGEQKVLGQSMVYSQPADCMSIATTAVASALIDKLMDQAYSSALVLDDEGMNFAPLCRPFLEVVEVPFGIGVGQDFVS